MEADSGELRRLQWFFRIVCRASRLIDRRFGGPRSLMYQAAQRERTSWFSAGWYRQRRHRAMAGLCQVGEAFTPPSEEQSAHQDMGPPSVGFIKLRVGKRREHAERVRPHLRVAARFNLPEDRLVEWLEFNGVPPPSGSKWSLRIVRRIGRRLGLRTYRSSLPEGRNPAADMPEDDMRQRRQER